MTKNIIKYIGLALVIIGIILVAKNLFTSDTEWSSDNKNNQKNKEGYYSVRISLLDKETNAFLTGANLVIKDESGTVVSGWTSEGGIHLVNELKSGSYTLEEESAPEGYHLNEDNITFKIKDSDEEVVMYNIAYTEEEKQYATNNLQNTPSNEEVGVENTLSTKNPFTYLLAVLSIGIGSILIFSKTYSYQKECNK